MNRNTIKGIIFDMDGTMFDSEKIWRQMWYELPKKFGKASNSDVGVDMCGTSGEASYRVVRKYFPELNPEEFVKKGLDTYREMVFGKQPDEKPYLHELVEYLYEQGYVLAVASGSPHELIKLNLERAGMQQYFSALVSGQSVPCGKPAPDIFLKAASEIGLKPEECIVVEDGENGIRAAAAAGCVPIMIPDLNQPCKEVRDMCSAVYTTMGDLLKAMKQDKEE